MSGISECLECLQITDPRFITEFDASFLICKVARCLWCIGHESQYSVAWKIQGRTAPTLGSINLQQTCNALVKSQKVNSTPQVGHSFIRFQRVNPSFTTNMKEAAVEEVRIIS